MVALRQRNLKLFTLALTFFAVFITTFLLNYTQNSGGHTVLSRFSEQLRRLMTSGRHCSCDTCVAEPEISLWFDERFNLSISPLLTKQNNVIPDSVYVWWLRLQGETNPKDINQVVEELFQTIPGDPDLTDHSPYRCRSCAVVGNSGNLKNSQYGPDIDSHDFVLRMNRAPTANYEMDVGSRTTHHFMYPESVQDLRSNVSMILVPFKTLDLQWIISALTDGSINYTYVPVPRKIRVNKDKILVYSPELMKYIHDKWLMKHGRYPSTGILSVIFALHICDKALKKHEERYKSYLSNLYSLRDIHKVDLYGFGADSKGNWHHYWETNYASGAFRKTGVHNGDIEAEIIANLSTINKVLLFKGR